jgi:hypothetical protein
MPDVETLLVSLRAPACGKMSVNELTLSYNSLMGTAGFFKGTVKFWKGIER